ncbi:MAG TPA: histidine phosphatase family protein [Dermatophilaceae bacterium]
MSDLQCPATLLIARHGDAEYTVAGALSDDGGRLTDLGRRQVKELVDTLGSRRIAAVYSSRMVRAVESADLAAAGLGVRRVVTEGLQEPSVGELAGVSFQDPRAHQVFDAWLQGNLDAGYPGGEDGHTVMKRFKEALEDIADTHRGETVLVFTHSGVMSLVVPRLSVNVRNDLAAQRLPPNCALAEVEVDADGWRILSWPGTTVE